MFFLGFHSCSAVKPQRQHIKVLVARLGHQRQHACHSKHIIVTAADLPLGVYLSSAEALALLTATEDPNLLVDTDAMPPNPQGPTDSQDLTCATDDMVRTHTEYHTCYAHAPVPYKHTLHAACTTSLAGWVLQVCTLAAGEST
jgi:hypothetical protein